ncbi:transposase, TnpA family [Methylocaldum marinum]|uniref:Transposase, TnpA family n=1 Tax=Methylocaldum marinum TaxID=1432792 RepID=A0A250KZF6_9GAMM|nr:DUF4158 domain-containing protein [Methylocaldum marinum]BBA36997.1 transposase, TnpA family [Methylocaldum marinum]
MMTAKEKFLTQRQRYQPVTLPQDFSDEEMARDWTLSEADKKEVNRYRTNSRLFIAIQLCAVRLYGRFLVEVNDLSPRIVSYLNSQLELPPSLTINTPDRDATFSEQRKNILTYLGFSKYDDSAQASLEKWLSKQAEQGYLVPERMEMGSGLVIKHAGIQDLTPFPLDDIKKNTSYGDFIVKFRPRFASLLTLSGVPMKVGRYWKLVFIYFWDRGCRQ